MVTVTTSNRNRIPTTITWTIAFRVDILVVHSHRRRRPCIVHRIWPVIIISIMLFKRLNWWHRLEEIEGEILYESPPIDCVECERVMLERMEIMKIFKILLLTAYYHPLSIMTRKEHWDLLTDFSKRERERWTLESIQKSFSFYLMKMLRPWYLLMASVPSVKG